MPNCAPLEAIMDFAHIVGLVILLRQFFRLVVMVDRLGHQLDLIERRLRGHDAD